MAESRATAAASSNHQSIVDFYLLAKRTVLSEGYEREISWQKNLNLSTTTESAFLREAAWVVLSCGMREGVVRRKFPALSLAFGNWASAASILQRRHDCMKSAMRIFAHAGKINSIIEIARAVHAVGFESFKSRIACEGIDFLRSLPFIGPATSLHLAKNIGLDVVKPDRHLRRISAIAGYSRPVDLCQVIADNVGDRISVVDLVVWRYATLNPGYVHFLTIYFR